MSPTGRPATATVGLPPEQFAATFPFHLALDRDLRLIQAGSTLRRICPDVRPGADLDRIFLPIRPEGEMTLKWVQENSLRFFLLEHRATKLQLRGEFILLPADDTLLFLGSPWFTDTSEIAERGLGYEDFAIHDPVVDMLQVFQASKLALADAKKLAAKLTVQRAELRDANERLRRQEAETRKLALIAARTDNAVVLTDAVGATIWVNEGFTRLTGYTLAEMLGKAPGSILQGPGTDAGTARRLDERRRRGEGFTGEILNYGKEGSACWFSIEGHPVRDDAGHMTHYMTIQTDITSRRAAQQRLAIQLEVARVLAESDDFATIIQQVLRAIGERLGWQAGQIWRVTGDRLRSMGDWHAGTVHLDGFIQTCRALEFPHGEALPGRVWANGRPLWVQDLAKEALDQRNSIAVKVGLHGAFAFPVMVRGEVRAVGEFFSNRIETPDDDLLRSFAAVGHQIGVFMTRREVEEALNETSALQRAILDGANYAIISAAPDGIIQTFNSTAERMLGYTSEEVVGEVTPAFIHDAGEVIARAAELTRELGRTVEPGFAAIVAKAELGEPDEREWTYIRKDGNRFPVLLSVTTLSDEQGKVTGYLGVASDITERKRAEAELKLQKTYLELLLDHSPAAVTVLDNDDGVLRINHAFTSLFGYRSSEAVGRKINDLVAPENLSAEVAQVSARGMAGERLDLETVRRAQDGTLRNVRLLGQHIVVDGQQVASLATYIDVSAQKQVEADMIEARQAAEAANRAKGDFLAMMSHEIRTPMNAVLGMTNLLLETSLDTKQKEFARTVARSGEALIEIINEILDFSKIESGGQFQFEEEVFSLRRFVEDVVLLLRPQAEAGGIALTAEVAAGMPDTLKSDAGRLRQVLVNLVGNAIKFTDRGGVSVRVQGRRQDADHVHLRFEVRDTGIGMTSDNIDRLFQPFIQVDSSTSRRRGGTGLGLAISKRIVDLMGGRIGVESTPGQGSLFWFELGVAVAETPATGSERFAPDALSAGRTSSPAIRAAVLLRPLRILVAEDHDINRRFVMFMLESLGHRADFAGNGLEAVTAWQSFDHDIILMDCQMPEMDGFEATKEIRRRELARTPLLPRRVRIIALTANALKGDRERCLAAGMDGYVTKPFTMRDLEAALEPDDRDLTAFSAKATARERPDAALDTARLEQLCSDLGDGDVCSIAGDFLSDLPRLVARLQSLADAGDLPELMRNAHSLQGISQALGLLRLHAVCIDLENAAKDDAQDRLQSRSALLPGIAQEARTCLGGWMAERAR
jgi:PAS domain S-box-containing protein